MAVRNPTHALSALGDCIVKIIQSQLVTNILQCCFLMQINRLICSKGCCLLLTRQIYLLPLGWKPTSHTTILNPGPYKSGIVFSQPILRANHQSTISPCKFWSPIDSPIVLFPEIDNFQTFGTMEPHPMQTM